MREGSKAVWNFSENPSVLEAPPDPNDNDIMILTPKNAFVDPQQKVPYLILVCLARSSAEFTGEDIFDAVRKAGQENLINFSFLDQQTRQVCSVGGYHDEGEEPPHAGHHSGRDRPGDGVGQH